MFETKIVLVVQSLSEGKQPPHKLINDIGYLMRTTAVYGNGKFGIDDRKMSKSYNNTIPIFADYDTIKNQVMNIVTDSAGLNDPKDTNTPLFKIYSLFLDIDSQNELTDRYNTPGLKYMEIKEELVDTIISFFEQNKSKKEKLLLNIDEVDEKMLLGKSKAQKVAQQTLEKVKSATGLL